MTPPAHQPRTGRVLPHAHSLATARMRLRAVTGQCAGAWWLAPWRSPWQPLQSLMHGKYALSIAKTPIRAVVDAVLWLWSRTRCDRQRILRRAARYGWRQPARTNVNQGTRCAASALIFRVAAVFDESGRAHV